MSFQSGTLLLLMMAQAAFGYALVDPSRAPWFRQVHLVGALVVLVLALRLDVAARRLPFPGPRTSALRGLVRLLALGLIVQAVVGLAFRGLLPAALAAPGFHIGLGLLLTLLVLAVHMTCIWPSIRLGARREWEASLGRGGHDPDRKV